MPNACNQELQCAHSYRTYPESDYGEPQGQHYRREQVICFKCDGKGHMRRDCPTKDDNQTVQKQFINTNHYQNKNITNDKYKSTNTYNKCGSTNTSPNRGRVLTCFLCGQPNHKVQDCPKNINKTRSVRVQEESLDDDVVNQASKANHSNKSS